MNRVYLMVSYWTLTGSKFISILKVLTAYQESEKERTSERERERKQSRG